MQDPDSVRGAIYRAFGASSRGIPSPVHTPDRRHRGCRPESRPSTAAGGRPSPAGPDDAGQPRHARRLLPPPARGGRLRGRDDGRVHELRSHEAEALAEVGGRGLGLVEAAGPVRPLSSAEHTGDVPDAVLETVPEGAEGDAIRPRGLASLTRGAPSSPHLIQLHSRGPSPLARRWPQSAKCCATLPSEWQSARVVPPQWRPSAKHYVVSRFGGPPRTPPSAMRVCAGTPRAPKRRSASPCGSEWCGRAT